MWHLSVNVAASRGGTSVARRLDSKRWWWTAGLLVPTLPFMAWGLVSATGQGAFWWWGPFFVFAVMPLLDVAAGVDKSNPREEDVPVLEADPFYLWVANLFLPLQYAGWLTSAWLLTRGDLGTADKVGLTLTTGMVAGIAIANAHELGHKKEAVEKWLAKIVLVQSCYGHFVTEHNRGHHVRVATPEDPASARLGESFWAFWPRTVVGGLRSSWHLEKTRLQRDGRSPWTLRNDILGAWALTVVVWGALLAAFGTALLPWLLLQALVGFSLLEVVNYLEHYGLLRQKVGDRYERTQPTHSWNANNVASNVLLYHLQRHSDHHANPLRRYQSLRHMEEAPQLPTGYAAMILLAVVPPVWRRVMDPRVLAHYGGDVTLANLHPRARRRYLTRYAAPRTTTAAA
jgi:alkane 1-monooxygenase